MEIKFTSLHQIDHIEERIEKIDINNQGNILGQYIQRLLNEITNSPNKRSFLFQRETTEIRSAINNLISEDYETGSEIIANRLLPIEQAAQERIAHLGVEIQKGSLFQTIIENEDGKFVIISKADHNEFLDEIDFLIHKGLPWKKRVFKAFMAKIENDSTLSSIIIYDTNTTKSMYWWENYFEIKEKHNDTHNTRTSLDTLDKKVFNPIKKDYPADHTILRNSTIGYFRNKEEFALQEYISEIFDNYTPVDENFPLQRTKNKIADLPERWNFDRRFLISKGDIDKRAVNKIRLTENIDLILKDYVNFDDTITAEMNDEGDKFIRIKTVNGYNKFKKNNQ